MKDASPEMMSIFCAALERSTAKERAAYLETACGKDVETRARLEALLRAHEEAGGFLPEEPPTREPGGTCAPPASERPGTVLGPYKLLQQIGEGGMGIVWMAEQTQPVQRKVALKVIKPGMDSRQVIARFEAERQALALMDHVNIARVLDAGATPAGLPYFVMELVHGLPITQYCDDNHLTPRARLELFVPVCQAIQHAHQKGIIHRDLKPSNVLITLYDGKPAPKVIDFGVAKATGQRLTEKTLFTQYGTVVGTLEYMSPEQAEMSAVGVDTRSDIYSLGVLLYELLTGSTPLSHQRVREAAYGEVLRLIKEEEAPKPSLRLSTSGAALASISAQRHMEPARLTKLLRGELDWIVMKTLEKDRNRRYDTANSFAADVQRYLNDEPVAACPASAGYKLRKYARKHRRAFLLAAGFVALLVLGVVVSTWQAVRATRAEGEARAREGQALAAAEAERKAKETTETRAAETRAVLDFVEKKVFAPARPENQEGGLGREVTLRKAVEAALPFVAKSFPNQPLIEARLRLTLGTSFYHLGEAKLAAEQYQTARALYTRHCGPDHPETLRSMMRLARSYAYLGRRADALKLREETLALMKARLGPNHPDTLTSMQDLATSYGNIGRHADALKLRQETLALRTATLGPDHPDTLWSLHHLGNSYDNLGRHADALKVRAETLALRKARLGLDHPDTLWSMENLATTYGALGRRADALKLRQETLALRNVKLGPEHPDTLRSRTGLAVSYNAFGRHADAVKLLEETLPLQKARSGPDHPDTLWCMSNLVVSYYKVGRHADAVKLLEETLPLQKAKLGPDHPRTLASMNTLANSYGGLGRHADALKLREEMLALRKARLGPDHRETLGSMGNVAETLMKLDRGAEAVPIIDECLKRAAGKSVPRQLIPRVVDLRLRHYAKANDAAGCRQTAEMWEQLKRTDAGSLYNAARLRAVTAAVLRANDKSEKAAQDAAAEADRAMAWLKQAVAAGQKAAAHMKQDRDLDALRDRQDFKELLAEVEATK